MYQGHIICMYMYYMLKYVYTYIATSAENCVCETFISPYILSLQESSAY